jgi:hypothetical protein
MMRLSERPAPRPLGRKTAKERIEPLVREYVRDDPTALALMALAEEIDDLQEMINDLDRSKEER